jgi:two-component system phosphate regulon sensor histidine kinase PhoR
MTQLQSEKETIDAMMQNMQEGFILLDGQEDIITLNESARRILNPGYSSTGRRTNLLQFSRCPSLLAVIEHARSEGHAAQDMVLPQEGGRIYRVLVNRTQQDGLIVMMLDITAEAQAEQMRREFAANVSHELRTRSPPSRAFQS